MTECMLRHKCNPMYVNVDGVPFNIGKETSEQATPKLIYTQIWLPKKRAETTYEKFNSNDG